MEQSESPINESKPQSKIALMALNLSISSSLFCGVSIALFGIGIFTDTYHYGLSGLLALCVSCLGVLTPLAGIILGGVALARKEPQKAMAAIAIALGVLAIIATGFILFLTFVICCMAI